MIKICAQIIMNDTPENSWEKLGKEVEKQETSNNTERPKVGQVMTLEGGETLEVLRWDEKHGFKIRMTQQPYLKSLIIEVKLEALGVSNCRLHISLELKTMFMFLVRILYWLFRKPIQHYFIRSIAAMKYSIETGEKSDSIKLDDPRLSIQAVSIINCNQPKGMF